MFDKFNARKFHGFRKVLIPVLVLIGLQGCQNTLNGPERLFPIDKEIANLRDKFPLPDLMNPNRTDRNRFVAARMYAIDLAYTEYFTNLTRENQLGNFGFNVLLQGLTVGGTLAGGKGTPQIISALTGAANLTKTSYNNDILLTKTVQILQTQMESSRALIRERIQKRLLGDTTGNCYYLAFALSDLEEYYKAGTIAGALEDLSAAVGSKGQEQKTTANTTAPSGESLANSTPTSLAKVDAAAKALSKALLDAKNEAAKGTPRNVTAVPQSCPPI